MFDSSQNAALMLVSVVFASLIIMAILFIVFAGKLMYSKQYQKSREIMKSWKNKRTWDENPYLIDMGKVKTSYNNPSVVFLCVNKEAQVSYVTMELIEPGTLIIKKGSIGYTINCSKDITHDTFHKKAHTFGSKELMKFGISVLASRCNMGCNIVETFEIEEERKSLHLV